MLGISSIANTQNKVQLKEVQLKSKAAELKSLEIKYDHLQIELNKTDTTNKEQIDRLQQEKQHLEQERIRLEKELALKQEAKRIASQKLNQAAQSASGTQTAYAAPAPANCGTDPYMAQIYMRESGCRTTALNSIGCYGIGQSCPASKIAHCGSDFACQDAWFKAYAISRYGSYANAWAAWQTKHWW